MAQTIRKSAWKYMDLKLEKKEQKKQRCKEDSGCLLDQPRLRSQTELNRNKYLPTKGKVGRLYLNTD